MFAEVTSYKKCASFFLYHPVYQRKYFCDARSEELGSLNRKEKDVRVEAGRCNVILNVILCAF